MPNGSPLFYLNRLLTLILVVRRLIGKKLFFAYGGPLRRNLRAVRKSSSATRMKRSLRRFPFDDLQFVFTNLAGHDMAVARRALAKSQLAELLKEFLG